MRDGKTSSLWVASALNSDRSICMSLEKSICHITFSTSGGAGVVAKRLQEGQAADGVESRLLSMTDKNIQALLFSDPLLVGKALIDFYGVRRTKQSHLYSLLRNSSDISIQREIKTAEEILHFHWTPGVVSLEDIGTYLQGGRAIVWTLHDMWPFTGGCHHAMDCNQYETGCLQCPQTRSIFQRKARAAAERKREVFNSAKKIHFVSPSRWLANKAISSKALSNAQLHIVPNPIDCSLFKPGEKQMARSQYGISKDAFVVGCSSMNLADPMKNMHQLVNGMRKFVAETHDREIVLLAVGGGELSVDGCQTCLTGPISSEEQMASTYQAMDVFVSLSLAENFPLTVAEATASGVPVICLEKGGMPEIVIDGVTGRVIASEDQLAGVLTGFLSDAPALREMSVNSRKSAVETFSLESVLQKYDRIYNEVWN
jgi:glycosyltransferase involved in cell wall biosynthesis